MKSIERYFSSDIAYIWRWLITCVFPSELFINEVMRALRGCVCLRCCLVSTPPSPPLPLIGGRGCIVCCMDWSSEWA